MKEAYLKECLTSDAVLHIIKLLGYEVKGSGKFRLREERTPSTNINPRTGWITDWGSGWNGDIFDLLQTYHGMGFKEAVDYVVAALGLQEGEIEVRPVPGFQPVHKPPSYDVAKIYERMREGRRRLVARLGKEAAKERQAKDLIPASLWPWVDRESADRMIGFDTRNDSFTVSLLDGDEVKTVAIRRAGDTKWKTYGSKRYTPFRIDERPVVYVVYGMKEILLLECAGWPYIGFQSDGMARRPANVENIDLIKEKARGKVLALLLDNDTSCRETVGPLTVWFQDSVVVPVDFARLLSDVELQKGYDFFDFAAWCGSMEVAAWMINDLIESVPPYDGLDDEEAAA